MSEEPPKIPELLCQAKNAFNEAAYDTAQALFRQVINQVAGSPEASDSELFLRHLEPKARQLLAKIDTAADAHERLALINQAQEQGLIFDLRLQNLNDLHKGVEADIQAQANDGVQTLLRQGDELRSQGKLDEAEEQYQQAARALEAASEMREEAQKRLKDLDSLRQKHAQAQERVNEAETRIAVHDYWGAGAALAEARPLHPEHPDLDLLQQQVEANLKRIEAIENLLQKGDELLDQDPSSAETHYQEALKQAQDANLDRWKHEAKDRLDKVPEFRQARQERFQAALKAGREALGQQDLNAAILRLEEAGQLDRTHEVEELLNLARRLKEAAKRKVDARVQIDRLRDFEAARLLLREAQVLDPEDPETEALLKEVAERKERAESFSTTIGLWQVPYHSPQAMNRGIEEIQELFSPDKARDLEKTMVELYLRQAVADLRGQVEQEVVDALDQGRIDDAIHSGQALLREWDEYYAQEKMNRRDPDPYPALQARLNILRQQIEDARAARDVMGSLSTQHAELVQALDNQLFLDAVAIGDQALESLTTHPPAVQHVLRALHASLVAGTVRAVRLRAQQIETQLRQPLLEAQTHLDARQSELALDPLINARPLVQELEQLKDLYDRLTSKDGRDSWAGPPLWEEWQHLHKLATDTIRWDGWLGEARSYMADGEYDLAQENLKKIKVECEEHVDLKTWQELIEKLLPLKNQVLDSLAILDYDAAVGHLTDIQRLDGHARWSRDLLAEAQKKQARRRQADGDLAQAERDLAARLYPRAEQVAKQVLADYGDVLRPEDVGRAQSIRQQAADGQKYAEELKQWRIDARAALKRGELIEALSAANRVLQVNEDDWVARDVQQQAQQALRLVEAAKEAMEAEDLEGYQEAEAKLRKARRYAPNSPDIEVLLRQVRQERNQIQGPAQLLDEARYARDDEDWPRALEIAISALPHSVDYANIRVELEQIRDEAKDVLKRTIEAALPLPGDLKKLEAAEDARRTLRDCGLVDTSVSRQEPDLERAAAIFRARAFLAADQPERAREILEPLAQVHAGNPDFAREYATACFAVELWQARLILRPPISQPELEQALPHLEETVRLRPNARDASHWEKLVGIEQAKSANDWLAEVKLDFTLNLVRETLNGGALEKARELAHSLPASDPRVSDVLQEIGQIESTIASAENWDRDPQVTRKAVASLAELLPPHRTPGFQPAAVKRQEILDALWHRAQQGADSIDPAGLADAISHYETLLGLNPPNRGPIEREFQKARRKLDDELTALADDVNTALDNPNLRKHDCEALRDRVLNVPEKRREKRSALKEAERRLEERASEIGRLDNLLVSVRAALRDPKTHEQGSYLLVEGYLEQAIQVNSTLFGLRTEIVDLKREADDYKKKREEIRNHVKPQYDAAKKVIEGTAKPGGGTKAEEVVWEKVQRRLQLLGWSTQSTEQDEVQPTEDAEAIRRWVEWGEAWFLTTAELNRAWQRKDPENLYGCREWGNKQDPDPLENEHSTLLQQRTNLQSIRQKFTDALAANVVGQEKAIDAARYYEKPTKDKDYATAINTWQEADTAYDEALTALRGAPDPQSRWAITLQQQMNTLCQRILVACRNLQKKIAEAQDRLDKIRTARESARAAQYDDRDLNSMKYALQFWREVTALNPHDKEASEKTVELERDIKAEGKRRSRNRVLVVASAMAVVILATLAFLWAAGIVSQPTPTPMPVVDPLDTATFTPMATVTPSPTNTPTPTATATPTYTPTTTPTASPAPTATPQPCVLIHNGWVRDQPSDKGIGLALLKEGVQIGVVDRLSNEEGAWYRVAGFGEQAYIRAEVIRCVSP